jgi:hypothetical protein
MTKQVTKISSSNQLFLGVFAFPRRDGMLRRKWDMDQPLKTGLISGFHKTEQMMTQIFGRNRAVPYLRHIAATASKELSLPSPDKGQNDPI